ncbi:hypothetical protein L915_20714 [Phytophthora nicotianae]|uniref:Uncharacterized protein n=1 Tax=Phytophthora nicotianae TaxID=4792 RepID=W2FN74_PHYNI|nr:hypothetical protein L915_20714 [Phytophthora nicotianae]ETL25583.1 hypothetical protein L916_20583 [Phytophthora nicotianae]ETM32068.1 hypothetical protein L914_20456 [Phytophthora nicotianae]
MPTARDESFPALNWMLRRVSQVAGRIWLLVYGALRD